MELKANIAEAFEGLFQPYRYKVFYGGRGGAKSWAYADALIIMAAMGHERILCAREVQNSIKDSVKRLLDDRIEALGLRHLFISTDAEIRCPTTNSLFIFGGLRSNPEKIKSFEGLTKCWIEEAETISERSYDVLIPTLRQDDSEIWFSFNPDRVNGYVYNRFVVNTPPPRSLVKKVSWRDNPWFPDVLKEEMETCKREDPDKWRHIWEGEPIRIAKGAYYARLLSIADDKDRIGPVGYEPELLVNTAWDLGVSDSTAIWFFQVLPTVHGQPEWRFIDYYENSGQGLPHYAEVLHSKGYDYGKHIGPHDIKVREFGSGKSRLEVGIKLGIRFEVCPNIGVQDGIDAVRGVLKTSYFDRNKCKEGLECLWSYQREWDEKMGTFKDKPLHDWTSHGADAMRYAAVGFRQPVRHNSPLRGHTVNSRAGRY